MKPNEKTPIELAAESIGCDKLRAIMLKSLDHLAELFSQHEDDIQAAINNAAAYCDDAGKIAPIAIGFAIKLDLNANKQTGKLTCAIRHSSETSSQIPDPQQPELL